MSRLQDWLAWGASRLGWPGLTGLALLVAGVATCGALVHPMEEEATGLEARALELARKPQTEAMPAALKDWREVLPRDLQAYGRLTQLFQAAHEAGLELDEGSYRTQSDTEAGITRLVIKLPVTGNYPSIRSFMGLALNQDTALALETLRLTRDLMSETELSADLGFALYLGGQP